MAHHEGEQLGEFPSTHWSLLGQAGGAVLSRGALEALLQRYQPALRAHLVYRWRLQPQDANDLLQGFICDKMLEQSLLAHADRKRGRFRTFLLTALDHFVVSQHRRDQASKRSGKVAGGLDLDALAEQGAPDADPSHAFDVAWGRVLIAQAVERMRDECQGSGRAYLFEMFEVRVLNPILQEGPAVPYERLVERFGFKTPLQASNALVTAKRMFERQLRLVVGEYAGDASEVESELMDLRRIFSRGGAS